VCPHHSYHNPQPSQSSLNTTYIRLMYPPWLLPTCAGITAAHNASMKVGQGSVWSREHHWLCSMHQDPRFWGLLSLIAPSLPCWSRCASHDFLCPPCAGHCPHHPRYDLSQGVIQQPVRLLRTIRADTCTHTHTRKSCQAGFCRPDVHACKLIRMKLMWTNVQAMFLVEPFFQTNKCPCVCADNPAYRLRAADRTVTSLAQV
jgi:hypothetical protein